MTAPAALLFAGRVMHVRHAAPATRFAYRIWMLGLDLDRLDEAAAGSRIFRHGRPGLVSLADRDHGPRDGSALRPWVDAALASAALPAASRIRFLAIPRVLGFAFNPIAFFFCYDAAGRLRAVLHQVKNTFGHQHAYLLPVEPDQGLRHVARKRMHVSPFFDLAGGYRFRCRPPDFTRADSRLMMSIQYGADAVPRMTATMRLDAEPMTDAALVRALLNTPLVGAKVVAAIHYQALKLWLRGARFHAVPPPPDQPVSLGAAG